MDLAKEFEAILQKYGRDVLVIRTEKKLLCSCYNEVTQEASRDCPICLGLGWKFIAERHRARSEGATTGGQIIRPIKAADIGDVSTKQRKYYFKPTMNASEKDLVVEVDWDNIGKPIYHGKGIWKIDTYEEFVLEEGNPIYKVYNTSVTPIRSKIRGIHISQINGIQEYTVLLEG